MTSLETEKLKALVRGKIDTHRQQLSELSLKIHANPEVITNIKEKFEQGK